MTNTYYTEEFEGDTYKAREYALNFFNDALRETSTTTLIRSKDGIVQLAFFDADSRPDVKAAFKNSPIEGGINYHSTWWTLSIGDSAYIKLDIELLDEVQLNFSVVFKLEAGNIGFFRLIEKSGYIYLAVQEDELNIFDLPTLGIKADTDFLKYVLDKVKADTKGFPKTRAKTDYKRPPKKD